MNDLLVTMGQLMDVKRDWPAISNELAVALQMPAASVDFQTNSTAFIIGKKLGTSFTFAEIPRLHPKIEIAHVAINKLTKQHRDELFGIFALIDVRSKRKGNKND